MFQRLYTYHDIPYPGSNIGNILDRHTQDNMPYLLFHIRMRIPAIVGSDSADRGHPRKAYILVTAILSPDGHDASTFGVSRPSL